MREGHRPPSLPAPPELVALESTQGDFAVLSFPLGDEPSESLTPAEVTVAQLILQGKSNREIAAQRGSTVRTVANQVASLFRKMNVRSRLELVTAAPMLRVAFAADAPLREK
jgi:DNA-binding NarL/FixJ family response regulator